MAAYDWIPTYEAASVNGYGDQSQRILHDILTSNPNAAALIASGAIRAPQQQGGGENYESGPGQQATGAGVDWTKLPTMGPGVNVPKGTAWLQTGSQYRVDPWTQKPIEAKPGMPTYNDPNYGNLQLTANRQKDPYFDLARNLVIAWVTAGMGGALAPAIGGAMGLGEGANPFIASLLKSIPSLAQSGGKNAGSVFGSLLGGATGIPGGSTLGGMAGSIFGPHG